MKLRVLLVIVLVLAFTQSALAQTATPTAQTAGATAQIRDRQGRVLGTATLTQAGTGVRVEVNLTGGLENAAGDHGIHFHSVGICAGDFTSAGAHFNPTNVQHPNHAGDLPNIQLFADGSATYNVTSARVTLGTGANSLLDAHGTALVIHAAADDMSADPAGNSGDRIACGVVQRVGAAVTPTVAATVAVTPTRTVAPTVAAVTTVTPTTVVTATVTRVVTATVTASPPTTLPTTGGDGAVLLITLLSIGALSLAGGLGLRRLHR